uniref:Uncharacterized protein n=1 Tax=Arundo donax TaxID=35708 RepID=A0A0A8ZWS2_ARUDO
MGALRIVIPHKNRHKVWSLIGSPFGYLEVERRTSI